MTDIKEPKGYVVAGVSYACLLSHPFDATRASKGYQTTLCFLRDYLADMSGRDGQEVQEEYEEKYQWRPIEPDIWSTNIAIGR